MKFLMAVKGFLCIILIYVFFNGFCKSFYWKIQAHLYFYRYFLYLLNLLNFNSFVHGLQDVLHRIFVHEVSSLQAESWHHLQDVAELKDWWAASSCQSTDGRWFNMAVKIHWTRSTLAFIMIMQFLFQPSVQWRSIEAKMPQKF